MTVEQLKPLLGKIVLFTRWNITAGKNEEVKGFLSKYENDNPSRTMVVMIYTEEYGWCVTTAACVIGEASE